MLRNIGITLVVVALAFALPAPALVYVLLNPLGLSSSVTISLAGLIGILAVLGLGWRGLHMLGFKRW